MVALEQMKEIGLNITTVGGILVMER